MIERYNTAEMKELWSEQSKFSTWLEVEIIAMQAMAEEGIIPNSAYENVKSKAKFSIERINAIEVEVKHDVIAFLTSVAENSGEDARFLHYGMTSSDLIDTANGVLLSRAGNLLKEELSELCKVVFAKAQEHKYTPCIGRSHGIHAEPTTFGLKMASWYAELCRNAQRLEKAIKGVSIGAISGAVGTYAHLPPKIEKRICELLDLQREVVSTQVVPRDRYSEFLFSLAQLAATLERIAVEIRHLQRTEVREVEEPFTKGQKGSSAMPHKRNPILTENITGLARLVRNMAAASLENNALWHERDISHSSVERIIIPDCTTLAHFMMRKIKKTIDGLVVYPENMKRNLELTNGLVFSGALLIELTKRGVSREKAYKIVQTHALESWDVVGSTSDVHAFLNRLLADENVVKLISERELRELFSMEKYFVHVDEIFERLQAC